MSQIPADTLARLDQGRTALARLIGRVRNHQADCGVPEAQACCGTEVFLALSMLTAEAMQTLLILALAELATQPAPSAPPALARLDFTPSDDADPGDAP